MTTTPCLRDVCRQMGIDPDEECHRAVWQWHFDIGLTLWPVCCPVRHWHPSTPDELNLLGWPTDGDGLQFRAKLLAQVANHGAFRLETVGDDEVEETPEGPMLSPLKLTRLRALFWAATSLLDLGVWLLPSRALPVGPQGRHTAEVRLMLSPANFDPREPAQVAGNRWRRELYARRHLSIGKVLLS